MKASIFERAADLIQYKGWKSACEAILYLSGNNLDEINLWAEKARRALVNIHYGTGKCVQQCDYSMCNRYLLETVACECLQEYPHEA